MINYDTIISNFDDKVTLYNWLRKVEEALKNASATNFVVNKKGNATLSFSITFADGETLESGDIVLQQGESVDDARIAGGILQLHLTNGTWLTAGNVKAVSGFNINESQHLIVTYQDGTNQDLGNIYNGNVVVNGTFKQTQPNEKANVTWDGISNKLTISNSYSVIEEINGVLHCIINVKLQNTSGSSLTFQSISTGWIHVSNAIATKLIDMKGNDVTTKPASDVLITASCATFIKNGYDFNATRYKGEMLIYNVPANGSFSIKFNADSTISMNDQDFVLLTARVAMTTI